MQPSNPELKEEKKEVKEPDVPESAESREKTRWEMCKSWCDWKNKRTYYSFAQGCTAVAVSGLPFETFVLYSAGFSLGSFLFMLGYLALKNHEVAEQNDKKQKENKIIRTRYNEECFEEKAITAEAISPTRYFKMGTSDEPTCFGVAAISWCFLLAAATSITAFGFFAQFTELEADKKEHNTYLQKASTLFGLCSVLFALPHMLHASNLRAYQTSLTHEHQALHEEAFSKAKEQRGQIRTLDEKLAATNTQFSVLQERLIESQTESKALEATSKEREQWLRATLTQHAKTMEENLMVFKRRIEAKSGELDANMGQLNEKLSQLKLRRS